MCATDSFNLCSVYTGRLTKLCTSCFQSHVQWNMDFVVMKNITAYHSTGTQQTRHIVAQSVYAAVQNVQHIILSIMWDRWTSHYFSGAGRFIKCVIHIHLISAQCILPGLLNSTHLHDFVLWAASPDAILMNNTRTYGALTCGSKTHSILNKNCVLDI